MKLLTKFTGLSLLLLMNFATVFAFPDYLNCRKRDMKKQEDPTITIIKLVEVAYNDSISKLLFNYEVKRMQSEFNTSIPERKERMEKFLELSKKEKLSDDDIKYVAAELGFDNTEEYNKYFDLASKLIEKYEIMKLDKESQLVFCELFFKMQIEEMKGKGSIDFIKFNKNMSFYDPYFPLECKKCVYDYQQCMMGSATGLNTVFSRAEARTVGQIVADGGSLLTSSTATNQGIFIYTTWNTGSCIGYYRNCINTCKN